MLGVEDQLAWIVVIKRFSGLVVHDRLRFPFPDDQVGDPDDGRQTRSKVQKERFLDRNNLAARMPVLAKERDGAPQGTVAILIEIGHAQAGEQIIRLRSSIFFVEAIEAWRRFLYRPRSP